MAIAGVSVGCYTMYLKDGELKQLKSTGQDSTVIHLKKETIDCLRAGEPLKDEVAELAPVMDAAQRILDGAKVDVLADAITLGLVRKFIKEGQVNE